MANYERNVVLRESVCTTLINYTVQFITELLQRKTRIKKSNIETFNLMLKY